MSINVAERKSSIEISSFMDYIYANPHDLKIQEHFLRFQNHYRMQDHIRTFGISKGEVLFQDLKKENLYRLDATISPYLFNKCSTDLLKKTYDTFESNKIVYSDRLQEFIDKQMEMRNNIKNFIESLDVKMGHYDNGVQTLYVPRITPLTVFNVDKEEHNFVQYVRSYVCNIFDISSTHKESNPLKTADLATKKKILYELNRYIFQWENKDLRPLD